MGAIFSYVLIASLLLVCGGLVAYFVLKHKKRKEKYNNQFNITTKHGIRIKLSPETKNIAKETFEEWTESVVDFWYEKKGWDKAKSYKMLGKMAMFIYDEQYLNRAGIKVQQGIRGITWPLKFEIEYAVKPKEPNDTAFRKLSSLFRHETSHVLAGFVGDIPFDNDIHHKLFADIGLGA